MEEKNELYPNVTSFEKHMLDIDDIKLDDFKGEQERNRYLERYRIYSVIDLYLRIRHLRYKNYLSNEFGIPFTDEEIFDMASPIISKKMDYNDSVIDDIAFDEDDLSVISHYTSILDRLKHSLNTTVKDFRQLFPNQKSLKFQESEKAYIEDIIFLRKLRELGIDEYAEKVIHDVLGEELTIKESPKTKKYQNNVH